MRLILMRHAKAASGEGLPDHDRPLTEQGVRDARTMGRWLRDHDVDPDVVWCSSALRARQTWSAAAAALSESSEPTEPSYLRSVYQAGPGDLLDLLRDVPADTGSVLIVGHNPTMQEALTAWTGEARGFPTGGIAVTEWEGSWSAPGAVRLVTFGGPRSVGS